MIRAGRAPRLAARTFTRGESDGYPRTRYHGQPRTGPRSSGANNALDMRLAISELEGAHALFMRSDDADLTPIERREFTEDAKAKARLAGRLIDGVVDHLPRSWR